MKRIEKDIKKNSAKLIESSLPEIDALDSIPTKAKKTFKFPFYLIPAGVAACAAAAIIIPLSLKVAAPHSSIQPSNNTSYQQPSTQLPVPTSNPGGNQNHNHSYHYDLDSYTPTLNNFNEVAYYSYSFYKAPNSNALHKRNQLLKINDEVEAETPETSSSSPSQRTAYTDYYGRLHYPIDLDRPITFSDFLFFEFDTVDNIFLEERIGNGHIYGLTLATDVFYDENIIILKNGDKYYSCFKNGAGYYNDGTVYMNFSAHKFIEGFDLIKDSTNKRRIDLYFGNNGNGTFYNESLTSINIEGNVFNIDPSTVMYDNVSVQCTYEEMRERFNLDSEYEIIDDYGGEDRLVYDASQAEELPTFELEEFSGTFNIKGDKLCLNDNELITLYNVSKIYASEINKDSSRDLVFESYENETRMFNIYDVKRNRFLYHKAVSEIGNNYDYYLDMIDNRLVVKVLEPGQTDNRYMVDYGYFAYYGFDGITINWKNPFELTSLQLMAIYEADGTTPVEEVSTHYVFHSNTPYIVQMKLNKYTDDNLNYPRDGLEIRYSPSKYISNMPNLTPNWSLISESGGIYRYQISFQESGYSYYTIFFHRYSFDLRCAVDVSIEPSQQQ